MKPLIYPDLPILIVDDEVNDLDCLEMILEAENITNIITCQDSRKVLPMLKEKKAGVILLDLTMPFVSGEEILEEVKKEYPSLPVIITTGNNDVELAVNCIKQGAFDYIVKPIEKNKLLSTLRHAIQINELRNENMSLREHILNESSHENKAFSKIVTKNKNMSSIFNYLEAISSSPYQVLITGETGTGKELIAQAIHDLSGRKGKFVAVNLAGIDDNVFADTLFGHNKGAFTDARDVRPGLLKKAEGGTILFDEIGDLSPKTQIMLLRLIQEKEYYPLGSDIPQTTDAKMIASTHKDLKALVAKGQFRKDLYYRLTHHHVNLPPLRERKDDINLLVDHFICLASKDLNKKTPTYPKELITILKNYEFPGNVREFKNLIFDAVNNHKKSILSLDSFRGLIKSDQKLKENEFEEEKTNDIEKLLEKLNFLPTVKEIESLLIKNALKRTNNNQKQAADLIAISRRSLIRKVNELNKCK